jgi:aminopeptidase N
MVSARHGYLDRATYQFTFTHPKKLKIASVGARQSEEPNPDDKEFTVTKYSMRLPVSLVTFALGPFERHNDTIKWDDGSKPIPVEFSSLPGSAVAIKEDFILAELNNAVRYFHLLFGAYPYENFGAAFHPYAFGQGFPSMLMIPNADRANKYTYSFISHETAHQWWGNIVAWRSYRDQWLSEGFAEYSGVLYTALRQNPKAAEHLIDEMRQSLKEPPLAIGKYGKGKLNDVGPIILGHRLDTSKTYNAYETLIYSKGALVLRMLHFLMSNPATKDDKEFFNMMKDFVERYRNKVASTDDFRNVANEHFARTPIAQRYRLTDLNWFFQQWVNGTDFPSYQLSYQIEDQPDGSVIVSGTVTQENVPDKFFMVLPVVFTFANNQFGSATVAALGPKTPFRIKLPARPVKVELDPDKWVLSEKTSTN